VEMGNSSSELIDYFLKRSQRGRPASKRTEPLKQSRDREGAESE